MVSTVSVKGTTKKSPSENKLRREATELLRGGGFLCCVSAVVEALGVVGERINGLVLFLAMLTAKFDTPVSVLVTGPSSSGKSNLIRSVLCLCPPGIVIELASMSAKAPVYGKEPLAGKVLYITEQHGSKDARYLLRLLQSEGAIAHEFTTLQGRNRATELAQRSGVPVVFTSTTAEHIFDDDATRFLSLPVDQSEEQTRAILRAELTRPPAQNTHALSVIRKAVEILREHKVNFELPEWFVTVAENVPPTVRSRRDWRRFLSLCNAIALIRVHRTCDAIPATATVDLSDYAVAHRLLNRVFSRTPANMRSATDELIAAVEILHRKTHAAVSAKEIAHFLRWEMPTVYKHIEAAVRLNSLYYEPGAHPNNKKPLVPKGRGPSDFLLSPRGLLRLHPELRRCKFVDPITGKTKVIRDER